MSVVLVSDPGLLNTGHVLLNMPQYRVVERKQLTGLNVGHILLNMPQYRVVEHKQLTGKQHNMYCGSFHG
jgi:hypothetical protein